MEFRLNALHKSFYPDTYIETLNKSIQHGVQVECLKNLYILKLMLKILTKVFSFKLRLHTFV